MWMIDYDNDTGLNDDTFSEWWTVSDGKRTFKSDIEADAEWLCELLNNEIKMKAFALAVEKAVIFGSGNKPKEEG